MMINGRLKNIVVNTLRIDESDYSEDLALGDVKQWDSLAHLNLLMAAEKEFRIIFDVAEAADIESVGDLIDAIQRHQ